jgi:hypothetical protein
VGSSITLAIAIPPATTASPPGPGGGWIDGTPWPDRGATNYGTTVQSVTNSTTFVVDATAAPTPGVSRVSCVVGPDWIVRTARVLTVSGSTGAWTITIDVAFPGVVVGTPLWPAATNAQTYVNAVLAQYAIMGPGEKTTNTSSLVRGYRHPRPSLAWPSGLGPHMLSAVVRSAVEVTSVEYLLRQDSFGFLYGSSGVLTPPVPASITAAPNIYVPFYMSFYPVL